MVLSCARGPAHLPRQYGLADGYSDVSVMPLIILGPQLRAVKLQVAETMKALAARSTVLLQSSQPRPEPGGAPG